MLLSISLIWSEKPTHFIYQNKNSIITNERTDLSFSGGKVPKWQGSTCQSIPQNHKHNLYFHLNRCPFSLWTIANWSLRSTHAQIHKYTKTLTPKPCAFFLIGKFGLFLCGWVIIQSADSVIIFRKWVSVEKKNHSVWCSKWR